MDADQTTIAGKRRGQHQFNRLTDKKIKSNLAPGRYSDGGCLHLEVDRNRNKRWIARVTVNGKRHDMGLGGYPFVSLAEARELSSDARRLARVGTNPIVARRKSQIVTISYEEAARQCHAEISSSFHNSKHAEQWLTTQVTYVFPVFGDLPVVDVCSENVVAALKPVWTTKPETAKRILQRIDRTLNWAHAHGFEVVHDAVARAKKIKPSTRRVVRHFETIGYDALPEFVSNAKGLRTSETVRLALLLIIHTAMRTGELVPLRWDEVDFDMETITIPPERQLKKSVPTAHVIPLTKEVIQTLRRLEVLSNGSEYVFPGRSGGGHISLGAMHQVLKRHECTFTVHGMRSAFRTWVDDKTAFRDRIAEQALGHAVKDKVQRAYRRGDGLEKRRELMQAWSEYLTGGNRSGPNLSTTRG